MREIKFRAWNKNTQKMIDLKKITPLVLHPDISTDGLYLPFIDDYTLMQSTGVKDRNGQEIFEGDIVKGGLPEFRGNCVGEVKYGGLSFSFIGTTDSTSPLDDDDDTWFFTVTNPNIKELPEIEVIGNIYENPNLLSPNPEIER